MRRVNRRAASVLCAAWLAGAAAGAAPAEAAPAGTITGVVRNRTTGRPQAGAEVRLSSGRRAGGGFLTRRARTDERGRFAFSGLPPGRDRYYALDARYRRGLFAGGVVTLPADTAQRPVVRTTLAVWETTTDPASITIARDLLFVVPGEDGVGVVESVRVDNAAHRAYIGRATTRAAAAPTLAFGLPAGADVSGVKILDASLDIPRLRPSELGFTTTIAIPPGRTRVTFTYPLTGSAGSYDLTRRALYPIVDYAVHAAAPLVVTSDLLERSGEVEVGGESYTRYSAPEPLDAGDVAPAAATAEARWNPLLATGLVALGTAASGAIAFALARRRRAPAPPSREELVTAIAELDLRHEDGELAPDDWARRRASLKARLAEPHESPPSP